MTATLITKLKLNQWQFTSDYTKLLLSKLLLLLIYNTNSLTNSLPSTHLYKLSS